MDSRVRWHKSDCKKPNITVEEGVPCCRGCSATSSALVSLLVAQNHARGGNIHLPKEAPLGEANLWWPPCVPYCSPQVDANTDTGPETDGKKTTMLSTEHKKTPSISPIYPSSLDSSHFRLIYLTESDDVSLPIHMQLEEFPLNDHPEYETVSYVWGGEDGDSTLCKPVFVGRFWDVILATGNCSALLHYLRPRKGCRAIWLDAICINQADDDEKPAQISRMCDIYTNCERVVAFFGQDLVSRPTERTFRPRIDFQQPIANHPASLGSNEPTDFLIACAKCSGMSRDQLFKRRYLTRIWIVQELLLPKKTIFPLGDSDILCDQDEARRLVIRTDQEQLDSATANRSLSNLLRATSQCQASDPRDRVYGLLGLFEPPDASLELVPDYSLSWRDCWVGAAAYVLLVEKNLVLLAHAVGNNHPLHLPSWVPDIQNTGSWFDDTISTIHGKDPRCIKDIGDTSTKDSKITASEKWMTEFVMYSVKNTEVTALKTNKWRCQESHRLVNSRSFCTMSLEAASVNTSDGALQIRALRIFDRPCRLSTETEENGLTSIWVRGPSAAARFRVVGLKHSVALDNVDQLFLISCQDSCSDDSFNTTSCTSQKVILALTTVLSKDDCGVVTVRDCCRAYDIHFYSMDHFDAKLQWIGTTTNEMHSLSWVRRSLQQMCIREYARQLKTDDWIFACIFPSPTATTWDLFPLLIRLSEIENFRQVPSALCDSICATAKAICPDFDPVIRDNCFFLTLKNEKKYLKWSRWNFKHGDIEKEDKFHNMLQSMESQASSLHGQYSYPSRVQDKAIWAFLKWDCFLGGRKRFPITVRISLNLLLSRMTATTLYIAMCYARGFSNSLNEDLETILRRCLRPNDDFVFYEGWGRSLVEELGLSWRLEKVTIM